ncbi:hypothetical protein D3C80_1539580 [compost metagenome]
MQILDLIAARDTQTGDGTVQTLVESLFQLTPFAQSLALYCVDLGLGASRHRADRFLDLTLGLLLSLLAIFDEGLEQLIAVLAHLRVGAQAGQPDLPRVLLDLADPVGFFVGSFLASHPALLN